MSELVKSVNTFTHDALIGGTEIPLKTKVVTLIQGSGTVARGTVLGKITIGAATVANNGAGTAGANTGTGTLTMDTTAPIKAGAKVGIYTAKCIAAATDSGTFRISDPDGFVLGDIAVGATFDNDIKFVIADGASADFVVGDGFKVTIAAGSGKHKPVNSANVDGSAVADCVATQTVVVAADADSKAEVYTQGLFNGDKLTFGGSDTTATHADRLRALNIFLTNEQ
jgi:hypothetical protein